jgi:hypothetical protein
MGAASNAVSDSKFALRFLEIVGSVRELAQ